MLPRWMLAVGVLVVSYGLTAGQPPEGGDEAPPPFKDQRLPAVENPTSKELSSFRFLVSGLQPAPIGQERTDLMEKMAKVLVHPLTWAEVQEARDPEYTIRHALDGVTNNPTRKDNTEWDGALKAVPATLSLNRDQSEEQQKLLDEFYPIMIVPIKQVLENKALIARVNAARLLDRWAQTGEARVADELMAILKHPGEHDAVRHYGFRGLQHLLEHPKKPIRDEKKLEAIGSLLYAELEKRCNMPSTQLDGAVEDELDGMRFVRRQVMRTLISLGRPMIIEAKSRAFGAKARREGPVAEWLLKLMTAQGVAPTPSMSERIEAALGLTRMDKRVSDTYQPDHSMHQFGLFVTSLFNEDLELQKYHSARLKEAYGAWPDVLPNQAETRSYHSRLKRNIDRAFGELYDPGSDPTAPADLSDWLRNNPTEAKTLFK